jgi:hypothetical protein
MRSALGRKRWAVLLAALLVLAVGCGAGGPRPTPGAHIVLVLRADGSGRVDFWVGGGMHSDRALRDLGERVTAALFHGKALRPTTVEPGTAFTFARTEVPQAYGPGRHPVFGVAGNDVRRALVAAGYPGYTLLIRVAPGAYLDRLPDTPARVRVLMEDLSGGPATDRSDRHAPSAASLGR